MNPMPAAGPQISLENQLRRMEEAPAAQPERRGSLLVDYSKNRANGTSPEESRRLSLDNNSSRRRSSTGTRRGSMSNSRRGSMDNSSSRRSSGGSCRRTSGGGLLRRRSDGPGLLPYFMEGRSDTRQNLTLYPVKKPRRGSSNSEKARKKERQPSLILEKRSGHRVSTVIELDSDMEDLGYLSDSVQDNKDGRNDDDDDGSIQFPDLGEDHRRRRDLEDPSSTDDTTEATSLDDSDVFFTLRRNVALPARSFTFDATVKSSTDRLNESLLVTSEDGENGKPLGRRSQLELARALHDSMKQLIVDLEEQELNESSHGKNAQSSNRPSLVKRKSLPSIRRPPMKQESFHSTTTRPSLATAARPPVPDRPSLLAKQNSMSSIINVAVGDTLAWLVESADRPIQTLDRASSLRDLFAKQNSFSNTRKKLPPRVYSRSMSSANLHDSFHSKRSTLSRSSHGSSKPSGPLRRSNSMRHDSSSKSTRKTSPPQRGQLRDFRKRSQKHFKTDDESSNGTKDHSRKLSSMDIDVSSHRRDTGSGSGSGSHSRRSKLGRAASASNVNCRTQRLSPKNSSSSRSKRRDLMDNSSGRKHLLRSKTTEERSPLRRFSNGMDDSNRRSQLKRGYSHSSILGGNSMRPQLFHRAGSFRGNRRLDDSSGMNNDNSQFVTGSRIRRL